LIVSFRSLRVGEYESLLGVKLKFLFLIILTFFSGTAFADGDQILYKEEVQCPQTPEAVNSLLEDIQTIQREFAENLKCNDINVQFSRLMNILDGTDLQNNGIDTIIVEIEAIISELKGMKAEFVYINQKMALIRELLENSYLTHDTIVILMVEVRKYFLDIPAPQHYFEAVHGVQAVLTKYITPTSGDGTPTAPARQDFLNLIFDNENTTLSVSDALRIQSYTSAVTEEAGVLITMIADAASNRGSIFNRNECQITQEDEWAATERVTGVLYESAAFISKIAGPYGVPIQIGASVFKGALQGFVSYQKRSRNVDFYDGDDGGISTRQFYENAVCLLEKTNAEAQRILNPNRHLERLLYVRTNVLEQFRNSIPTACIGCNQIALTLQTRNPIQSLDEFIEARVRLGQGLTPVEDAVLELAIEEAVNIDWLNQEIEKFRELTTASAGNVGAAEVIANLELVKDFLYETVTEDFLEYYQSRYRQAGRELDRKTSFLQRVFRDELEVIGERIDYSVLPNGYTEYVLHEVYGVDPEAEPLQYMQSQYDSLVATEFWTFESIYPSVVNMYFINSKANLLNRYSSHAISETLDSIRKWQEKDFNLRVINEYCEFFQDVYQFNDRVKDICESERTKESKLSVSYLAFSFAQLLGSEQRGLIEDRDGPIDFNLEDRFQVIKKLRSEVRDSTVFADLSFDFESLIEQENEFIIFDDEINFLPERGDESYGNWHTAALEIFTQNFGQRANGLKDIVQPSLSVDPLTVQ